MSGKRVLCTIGFSRKGLREFIGLLRGAGVAKVVDVRLHNTSQLAGFAKKDDLEFVLETFGIRYVHVPELAPTEEIMRRFKRVDRDWDAYAESFSLLLRERRAERLWGPPVFDDGVNCLLCAEHLPEHCHRRLVAEYLAAAYPEISVIHLV